MKPCIMTSQGKYFNLANPSPRDVDIRVIAHALSNLCRFTGHVGEFYSVAQHSISVSYLVNPEYALEGLLHDAAEAYVGDVASPLKQLLPDYKAIEHRVEYAVRAYFNLPYEMSRAVKHADLVMLATEKRDLMPAHEASDDTWAILQTVQAHPARIFPMPPMLARHSFMARFHELTHTAGIAA